MVEAGGRWGGGGGESDDLELSFNQLASIRTNNINNNNLTDTFSWALINATNCVVATISQVMQETYEMKKKTTKIKISRPRLRTSLFPIRRCCSSRSSRTCNGCPVWNETSFPFVIFFCCCCHSPSPLH